MDLPTPSGQARFAGGTGREKPESPDEAYPLTLTAAREADGYNTGVRSQSAPEEPDPLVARVHPETVETHCAGPGRTERVRVASRRGSVTAAVDADEAIPPGIVWLPIHHPAVNELTIPATDPDSDEPNLKQCAVQLAPVETAAALAESGRAD